MKKNFKIVLFILLLASLLLSGCVEFGEEIQKEVEKKHARPLAPPSEIVSFGDGNWVDVSCLLSKENKFLGYTNQKFRGSGVMIIWASFDTAQQFSISGYNEPSDVRTEEPNWGDKAVIQTTLYSQNELEVRFSQEGLKDEYVDFKKSGEYFYRIKITALDSGYHASYVTKMTTTANMAFVKAILDDPAKSRARLNVPATMSKGDKGITCFKELTIKTVNINKKPLSGATVKYQLDNKKQAIEIEGDTYKFKGTKLPKSFQLSTIINAKETRNILRNPKAGSTNIVILATDEQRYTRYINDLNDQGKLIWGPDFKLEDHFTIEETIGETQFETNIVIDTYYWRDGVVKFDVNSLSSEDIETPYHEGMHALWEKMSINNAGGSRDSYWGKLPENKANKNIIHENFAMDEAQAHLAGFFALKDYKGKTIYDTEFNVENAKNALKPGAKGNQIEGVVATLLVQGYGDKEYGDVLKDMVNVKKSYYDKHNEYPQHIGQFLSEKLKLSSGEEKKKWTNLANELNIEITLEEGDQIK